MPPALRDFLERCRRDSALQQQLQGTTSLEEIVRLASQVGFALKKRDLQLWAHHEAFEAPWWPWAEGDPLKRQAFFRGGSPP